MWFASSSISLFVVSFADVDLSRNVHLYRCIITSRQANSPYFLFTSFLMWSVSRRKSLRLHFHHSLGYRNSTNSHQACLFVATSCSSFHALISVSNSLLLEVLDLSIPPNSSSLLSVPMDGFSSYAFGRFSQFLQRQRLFRIFWLTGICWVLSINLTLVILSYNSKPN